MDKISIGKIIDVLEVVAPLSFQEGFDNAGLLCGDRDDECTGVFVCLDVSENVIEEAKARSCNLIISHHPLIFRGLKNLLPTSNVNKCVLKALQYGMTLYSSHTNLDAAADGVNTLLAKTLGIENFVPFSNERQEANYFGIGGIGELKREMEEREFLENVKEKLNAHNIRYVSGRSKRIKRVALCSGSGGEFIPVASAKGADCYLTADLKYHDFLDMENRMLLADIGHFESEEIVKRHIVSLISKNFCNFVPLFWDRTSNRVKNI